MGLDGGTYITRSDVLRGQSWDMATADNSRSTRGGNVTSTLKRKQIDTHTSRQVPAVLYAIPEFGVVLHTPQKQLCAIVLKSYRKKSRVIEDLISTHGIPEKRAGAPAAFQGNLCRRLSQQTTWDTCTTGKSICSFCSALRSDYLRIII